jgi:dTDP-4-dehydrorhamnose 3,5-epimerase
LNYYSPEKVTHTRFVDERGFFQERYTLIDLEKLTNSSFVQENFSYSKLGVIRGWHWQLPPFAQGKLVSCLAGKIHDAALDIRRESPTFGKIYEFELSPRKLESVWIPVGFAHAFQALEEDTFVLYSVTNKYNKEFSRTITPKDRSLPIRWPITNAILSENDDSASYLSQIPSEDLF